MKKLPHIMSNRHRGYHGLHIIHSSQTSMRKAHGWAVQDDSLGRMHVQRFIPRNKAIRLFQHILKGI